MAMTEGGVQPPPLEPADLYVYAHANGAIHLYRADGSAGFAPLGEVCALVASSPRVWLAGDVGTPIADQALASVRAAANEVVDYDPPSPPYEWHDGADALMTAAAFKQDALLDDLIDRGADVNAANAQRSTPLHHAAAAGNVHAIDRLLAAGADPDARNDAGLTPLLAAQACREHEAAMRLEAAGATPTYEAAATAVRFKKIHRLAQLGLWFVAFVLAIWPVVLVFSLNAGIALVLGVVAFVLLLRWLGPGGVAWRAPVPQTFDGRKLQGATILGRSVEVDLDTVTAAAYGPGVGGRGGRLIGSKLILFHPDGRRHSQRAMRGLLGKKGGIDELPDPEGPATVFLLDAWWEHEVLRPVGLRLISDPVTLTMLLREVLQRARRWEPDQPMNLIVARRTGRLQRRRRTPS